MTAVLEIDDVTLGYGSTAVVESFSMTVERGEAGCILGPSGVGKTTILRAIAGFHPVLSGEIRIDGKVVSSPNFQLAPEKRRIGMVFQDFALFPHLKVIQNVGIGLRKISKSERIKKSQSMLKRMGISKLAERYPHELSGGQQQRVAAARALAANPEMILMDEPFSNLDVDLREQILNEFRELFKTHSTTSVLVTHHQFIAFALSDNIAVINDGKLQQLDTPYRLYHEPNSRFVADFIGEGTFIPGAVISPGEIKTSLGIIQSSNGLREVGAQVEVLIRPDDIVLDDSSDMSFEVVNKAFRGAEIMYTLRLSDGEEILSLVPSHNNFSVGDRICVSVDIEHVVAF